MAVHDLTGRATRPDLAAYVRAVVDRAPPLTADQRARLAVLLAPALTPAERRKAS